ncbi:mobile mystery protein B [soil metagenome]
MLSSDGDGQTPLDDDDVDGLIPTWVTTRADLNEAEQTNIALARAKWLHRPTLGVLDDSALRRLHADMFGRVWRWAGKHRVHETSIGIDPADISIGLRGLVEDAGYWIPGDRAEAVARFHHRLVLIHAFPNGNGRHGRLSADVLTAALGLPQPRWGSDRQAYLAALRRADVDGDVSQLVGLMWPQPTQ